MPALPKRVRRAADVCPGRYYAYLVQRHLLGLLFMVLAAGLFFIAVYAARHGGAAWVIALASGALAVWMADLARRVLVRRRA